MQVKSLRQQLNEHLLEPERGKVNLRITSLQLSEDREIVRLALLVRAKYGTQLPVHCEDPDLMQMINELTPLIDKSRERYLRLIDPKF